MSPPKLTAPKIAPPDPLGQADDCSLDGAALEDDEDTDWIYPEIDGRAMTPDEKTAWLREMIRPALEDIERGDVLTMEEMDREIESWLLAAEEEEWKESSSLPVRRS